jgi:hypothetical protein
LLKEVFLQTAAGLDYLNAHVEVMPRPVWAEEGASLGGLRGVVVIPEIKQIDLLKDYGITDTVVRTLVEQQLREQGIGFVAPSEKQAEQPGLVITLRLMALPSQRLSPVMDTLCGSIRVSLRQPVRLLPHAVQGETPLCSATTWQTEGIVRWTTSQARVGLEQALTVLVHEFCQDYKKANAATAAEISSPEKP